MIINLIVMVELKLGLYWLLSMQFKFKSHYGKLYIIFFIFLEQYYCYSYAHVPFIFSYHPNVSQIGCYNIKTQRNKNIVSLKQQISSLKRSTTAESSEVIKHEYNIVY